MQDYTDLSRIQQRATEFEQKFYRDNNLKKIFNVNDEKLAIDYYAEKYQIDPISISTDQRNQAISEYKTDKGIFLEGANVYSQFLYENYGIGETIPTNEQEIIDTVTQETSWFKDRFKLDEIFGVSGLTEDYNKIKADGFNIMDTLALIGAAGTSLMLPGESAIEKGLQRGPASVLTSMGEALGELHDRKQSASQDNINRLTELDGFTEDYDRWNELKGMDGNYLDMNPELLKEKTALELKYGQDTFDMYKNNVDYLNRNVYPLDVIGDTVSTLGKTITELEILNNEYTKDIRSGAIEPDWKDPRFWSNQIPEVIGQFIGLIGLTVLTPGVPDEYGAAAYVINSLPINVMFSASEAADVRKSALEAGMSAEEADAKARTTFNWNVGLQSITGGAPGAFTKLAGSSKVFAAVTKTQWFGKASAIGIDAFLEGFEEVAQDSIRDYQLTGEYKMLAEKNIETFILGFAGGLFGGAVQMNQGEAFNKTYDQLVEIFPVAEELKNEKVKDGMTEIEARDAIITEIMEADQATVEKLIVNSSQKQVVEDLLKSTQSMKEQTNEIKRKALEDSNVEVRNSQIEGTKFRYDDADSNIRVIEGTKKTSQVDDNTAITNMVMKQLVKKYPNIEYDATKNTYTSKERVTKFSKEVNSRVDILNNLNSKLKNINEKLDVSGVKGYMKKNSLTNNDIHDIYDNDAMTATQYIEALRKLDITPRDTNMAKNIELGDRVNDMVDDFDNVNVKEYNKLSEDIKKQFGSTLSSGLKKMTELGLVTANDAATFKNQANVFKKAIEEDTKKELEKATETIEKQKEAAVKQKEDTKKIKDDNKQLTLELNEKRVPQRVVTIEDIKKDKTIGKTKEQAKIVKMKEIKDAKIVEEIKVVKEEDTTIDLKTKANVGVHYGDIGNIKKSEPAHRSGGRGTGHFGTGTYFLSTTSRSHTEGYSPKVSDNVHEINFDGYNLLKPKDNEDGLQLHSALKGVNDLSFVDDNILNVLNTDEFFLEHIDEIYDSREDALMLSDDKTMLEDIKDNIESNKYYKNMIDAIGKKLYREEAFMKGYDQFFDEAFETRGYDKNRKYNLYHDGDGHAFVVDIKKDRVFQILNDEKTAFGIYGDTDETITIPKYIQTEIWRGIVQSESDYANEQIDHFRMMLKHARNSKDNIEYGTKLFTFKDAIGIALKTDTRYAEGKNVDSASTSMIKSLGYEGIDVRHLTSLDNTTYGSIIYDLKGFPSKADTKAAAKKKPSRVVQYLNDNDIKIKDVVVNYGEVKEVSGIYGEAIYLNGPKIKLEDNKLANRNFMDITKYNMYVPKDKGEARNLSNVLEKQQELRDSIIDNIVADLFLDDEVKSTLRSYSTIKEINDILIEANLTENITYDRYSTEADYDKLFNAKQKSWINSLKEEMTLEKYEDPNFFEAGIFEFIDTVEEIKDFSTELEFNTNKVMSILKKDGNLIEDLGFDGVDFREYQTDTNKYQSILYTDFDGVEGKNIVAEIDKQNRDAAIKQETTKEIC